MSRKNGKPGNKASTETLLRRLASTAKRDTVRLRAIELLLLIEGKVKPTEISKPSKNKRINTLDDLVSTQTVEDTPNGQKVTFHYDALKAESLSAAR